jgi:hypothetical protein
MCATKKEHQIAGRVTADAANIDTLRRTEARLCNSNTLDPSLRLRMPGIATLLDFCPSLFRKISVK